MDYAKAMLLGIDQAGGQGKVEIALKFTFNT